MFCHLSVQIHLKLIYRLEPYGHLVSYKFINWFDLICDLKWQFIFANVKKYLFANISFLLFDLEIQSKQLNRLITYGLAGQ